MSAAPPRERQQDRTQSVQICTEERLVMRRRGHVCALSAGQWEAAGERVSFHRQDRRRSVLCRTGKQKGPPRQAFCLSRNRLGYA